MRGSSLLVGLAALSGASAQLHQLATRAGLLYFGTAVGEGQINDGTYMRYVDNTAEFGQLVPENGQKWDSTEPNRGQFSYGSADVVPRRAAANRQILRCHALVWHSQLPNWVRNGGFSSSTLQSVITTHINNVMGHFRGQCYAWDVVNEAVDDNGSWRSSVFYNTMGTSFLPFSFRAARAADPNTKLYYNDYNLEYNGAKTNRAVELVNIIQQAGAPIDGVGFQAHLIVGTTPTRSQLATVLRRFTALGVEVAYTELDIRHESLPPSSSALARQGGDYAAVVQSCLDVDACVGITIWGFTDRFSWIPGTFPGTGAALLYDDNYNRKPAWTSVSSVLAAAATGAPPTSTSTSAGPTTTGGPTTTSTTLSTRTSSSTSSSSVPTGGPEQVQWGQCGGIGWTGPTRCASPWTCHYVNDWYSQCY
ncbi:family 10 glycosyl hydrolase [Stachybotrys elegans]|uniref:Beta-xylanase n=1 Tax=Stachybotrys elegans TaxID=80388 RepID=A0A8K0SH09_9HYPO|nr:family 10 glycosyl hydrolase [Stachybotrys elegans]